MWEEREEEKEDLKVMSNDQTCVKRMSLQILKLYIINVNENMLTFFAKRKFICTKRLYK